EPVLHHHRHRLREWRPPPGARVRKDRRRRHRPVPPADRRRRPLLHGDGRARAEGGADGRRPGRGAPGAGGRAGGPLPRAVDPAGHQQHALGAHHRRAPPARGKGVHRPGAGAQPRRLLRKDVRGVVLRRVRAVQARERDRRRPLRAPSHARAAVDGRAQLVLPAQPLPGLPSRALRRQPRLHPSRVAPQRAAGAAGVGAGRHFHHPRAPFVGHPLPQGHVGRGDAGDVGVVRRASQLPDGHRLSGRRVVAGVVAGAASRRGQGHHAASRHHLARDAAVGRASPSRAGVGARLRDAGRRALQQVGGGGSGAGRGHRPLRPGRLPLLPPARSAVGRGRQ
ncbi:MAG: Methionyl-tRNA synthetase, partial [uncultured Gemmatimonadetes bacterium]